MATSDENAVLANTGPAIWAWDPERFRLVWANEQGLRFWGERGLQDLINRDFSSFDEATQDFNELMTAVLRRKNGQVRARMVLAPKGKPVRIDCRAQRVLLPDGRDGLRIEAVQAPVGDEAEVDRLREIIERTPNPISLFAEDGRLLMQNVAAAQSFGPDLESLAHRYGDRGLARDALRALLINGSYSQTIDLKTQLGPRQHRITMRRMYDPMTGGLAAIVFFTDIAHRSQVAAATLQGDASAESLLLSNLDTGAAVFDDALKVLYLSDSARRLVATESDNRDLNFGTLFPDDRQKIADALMRIRDGEAERVDLRLAIDDADGVPRWLRIEMRRGVWRGAAAWLATLMDITEERQTAVAMRRSVDDRDRTLEAMNIGLATIRRDGVVEAISPLAAEMLRVSADGLTGKPLDTAFDAPTARAFRAALQQNPEGSTSFSVSSPRRAPDADVSLKVMLNAVSHPTAVRRTVAFSETSADEGTENAIMMRSEAIARASHELRTPLNAIIGFTEIMLDDLDAIRSDVYREYLKDINDSGKYMSHLVQDMLDMRRIDADALSLDPEPIDLVALIRRIARDFDIPAREQNVTLTLSIEEGLPNVLGDEHTLRQALTNLLGNALKFTARPGWVRLSASSRSSGAVVIDVIDNGEGMSAEEITLAMRPYSQGRRNNKKFGGAGLGLPLAKGFVEANGAQFEITSKKQEGTSVRIVFPPNLMAID